MYTMICKLCDLPIESKSDIVKVLPRGRGQTTNFYHESCYESERKQRLIEWENQKHINERRK